MSVEEHSDEALQKDIEAFLNPRTHEYLEKCIKRSKQSQRLFSPSHALNIIRAFEQEIEHLHSPQIPENDYQATLDLWKKTFTRNILVPHYLVHDPHLDIEHVIHLMKKALYLACQEAKTETYARSFRQTIINSLRTVPPLERMKRARQILNSSLKVIEKLEKNLSLEKLMASFSKQHLEELVQEASKPLATQTDKAPETSSETRLIKRRVRASKPKSTGVDTEKLKTFLHNHMVSFIAPSLQTAPTLLAKLQVASSLLTHLEKKKDLIEQWIKEWQDKLETKEETLLSLSHELIPSLITQIRGEVLAHCCLDEIHSARKQGSSQTYASMREEILARYLRSYLQEPSLKDCFLEALREEERAERERFLPPSENLEPPSPKSPGKKSLWQRV